MNRGGHIFVLLLVILVLSSCGGGVPIADKILVTGKILTVNPEQPWAEGVAIRDNKIVAVGTTKDIKRWAGKETEIIDCKAALVLPGFIDSHVHGARGVDFATVGTDPSDAIAWHAGRGYTSLVASLATAALDDTRARLAELAPLVRAGALSGLHL